MAHSQSGSLRSGRPEASVTDKCFPDVPVSEASLTDIATSNRVSPGELAALKLALQKYKSKEIAKELGISEAAARKRLGEVYKKFSIKGKGPGKLAALEKHLTESCSTASAASAASNDAGESATRSVPVLNISSATSLVATAPVNNPRLPTEYVWNNAPALNLFQGRKDELKGLKRWVLSQTRQHNSARQNGHSVLAICGIGGIGKTYLALKLARAVQGHFHRVVWLSAREQPSQRDLFLSLFNLLKPDAADVLSVSLAEKSVHWLIHQIVLAMSEQRCLVLIDGFENVFESYQNKLRSERSEASTRPSQTPTFDATPRQQASLYKTGFGACGDFLRALQRSTRLPADGESSCVLLTSREKPRELFSVAENATAYLYTLNGLRDHEAAAMLSKFHLQGKPVDYRDLVERYYGHPMALRLAANAVKDVFYGQIRDFLDQEISVFDDLRSVIKTQFKRLSWLEIEVMYWLAINNKPCTLEDLQADIVAQDHKENLLYTLQSLERRFLIEVKHEGGSLFSLHPIVAEYARSRLIREIFEDLIHGDLSLFNAYALMKADAEEYLREFQRDYIVKPLIERLRNYLKSLHQVDQHLNQRLDFFRENNPYRLGYAGGNFVNLMVELSNGKLSQKDFSQLTIWQAYLQGAQLRDVNFNSCELNRSVFTETLSDVTAVAFNVSSRLPLLACADTSGRMHVWHTQFQGTAADQRYGQKWTEWAAHIGWLRAIAFVPSHNLLITGGDDKKLKLWQLPSSIQAPMTQARQLWQRSHEDWVMAITVSLNGDLLAVAGEESVRLYHTLSGKEIARFVHHATAQSSADMSADETALGLSSRLRKRSQIRALAFSPDGRWLASGGDDCVIRLWDVAALTHAKETTVLEGLNAVELAEHTNWVRSLQFTPDSHQLVSGSDDETVRVWSLQTHACEQVLHQPSDRVRSLAISPDGQFLASGGDDRQVLLWNLKTYQLLQSIPTAQSRIWSVTFQKRGRQLLLAAGGDKQTLMMWQIHAHPSDSVLASSMKQSLESVIADDANAQLTVKPRLMKTYRGYTGGIRSVSFLGDRRLLSGGDSRDLCVWDSQTGERKASLSLHQGRIWAVAVDLQCARIASASDDHTIRLWDINTGQCLTTLNDHTDWVRTIAFSHRGRFLASGSDDGSIRIWNTANGFCLKSLPCGAHWVRSVAFDPHNSRYLVSGGDDQIVRLWDRKEGIATRLAEHEHRIFSVAYSPDGDYVASGSDDNTVILWDVEKQEICDILEPSDLGIKSVAFSPDGHYLAAGGEDQVVYVWDMTVPDRTCFRLQPKDYTGLAGGIRSLAFSPDSRFIISGGLDEMIRMGDLQALKQSEMSFLQPLVQCDRPYENIKIESIKGLSGLQKANLLSLGAIDRTTSLLM